MWTLLIALRFTKRWANLQGYLSLGWIHFRFSVEIARDLPQFQAEKIRAEHQKPVTLDRTKRNSLQPNKSRPVPTGYVEHPKASERTSTKHRVGNLPVTAPVEVTFNHKFFGSKLVIGDMQIGVGLSRGPHRLEITRDQLLIDNVPQTVNQGDLERIKQLLRSVQTNQ